MKVSVVVPCYNHAPYLRQRMESILRQTEQDFELILLDDASTDGSAALLQSYASGARVAHVGLSAANSGSPFAQWMKGVSVARGQWVWIAESDDFAEPDFLEVMLRAAAAHPQCGLLGCRSRYVDEAGQPLWDLPGSAAGEVRVERGADFICRSLLLKEGLPNVSACLLRRDAIPAEAAALTAGMRLCGDWMLYLLMAERCDVAFVGAPLNSFRQHGGSASHGAEREGLTFIEGAALLDRYRAQRSLPAGYARAWGRQWAKYERRYHFGRPVRRAVARALRRYRALRLWHRAYQAKQLLACSK